jgi:galactose mutarotase-like enzyme
VIHRIENNKLQLAVKRYGAEIYSIKSASTGREFIWDANPKIWANHAPILFPIVGALKDGIYFYKGHQYSLPQHGFFRHNHAVELVDRTDSSLKFLLKSNNETRKVYPFDFEFITEYKLADNRIVINHEIVNTSDEEMYFSIGAHPAFKCPINDGEEYNDYYLEFEKEETAKSWKTDDGLIELEATEVFKLPNILNLHRDIFNQGALVFKDLKSRKISLKSRKSEQIVSISYEGFPYMGIWAKPMAEFVCIEPWLGIADSVNANQDITTKEGIIELAGKETFKAAYFIEIKE